MAIYASNGPFFDNYGSKLSYSGQHFVPSVGYYCFHSIMILLVTVLNYFIYLWRGYSEGQRSRSSKNEDQGHKKL